MNSCSFFPTILQEGTLETVASLMKLLLNVQNPVEDEMPVAFDWTQRRSPLANYW